MLPDAHRLHFWGPGCGFCDAQRVSVCRPRWSCRFLSAPRLIHAPPLPFVRGAATTRRPVLRWNCSTTTVADAVSLLRSPAFAGGPRTKPGGSSTVASRRISACPQQWEYHRRCVSTTSTTLWQRCLLASSAAARVGCPIPPDQSHYWPRPCPPTPPCSRVSTSRYGRRSILPLPPILAVLHVSCIEWACAWPGPPP